MQCLCALSLVGTGADMNLDVARISYILQDCSKSVNSCSEARYALVMQESDE